MVSNFNDSPIESAEDDLYGVLPFAKVLAKSFLSIKKPVGTTIALRGPWGSGKSSVVNLLRKELQGHPDTLHVSEFKCWWFRGEEVLALAFLQNLNSILSEELEDKVKGLVPKLGRGLLQAGPVIGTAAALITSGPLAALIGKSLDFSKIFFPKEDTLETTFKKLAEVLKKEKRRFLIIIDDMDRLNPEEALAIFRLVKSVGRLPNVMYLLVFDRELIEKAVRELYPAEGPHFLEKIVQAGFDLPEPMRTDLNQAILASIDKICDPGESEQHRIVNIFADVVAPYLTTPRHVVRFQNAISVTWPAIENEISLADFIALETLRLYEPSLFNSIRSGMSRLCSSKDQPERREQEDRFTEFLSGVHASNHETAKAALQRLFPRMEQQVSGFHAGWDEERRVCIEHHFNTYFQMSLGDNTLPVNDIKEMADRADDDEFIKNKFVEAANQRRRTDTSMVPVLLDELNTHAGKIQKDKVPALVKTLFEIHDEIDLDIDKDRGLLAVDTSLRYHWLIRRLTADRFTIEERTELYSEAIKGASLGWLTNFVSSVKGNHRDRKDGPKRPENCLTEERVVDEFIDYALKRIRAVAQDGSLLDHKRLISILDCWKNFLGNDASEVRAWIAPRLDNRKALVILAKHLTAETWSHSFDMPGLPDRVPKRSTTIKQCTDILDIGRFIAGLENLIASKDIDEESLQVVEVFMDAWRKQINGEDD